MVSCKDYLTAHQLAKEAFGEGFEGLDFGRMALLSNSPVSNRQGLSKPPLYQGPGGDTGRLWRDKVAQQRGSVLEVKEVRGC